MKSQQRWYIHVYTCRIDCRVPGLWTRQEITVATRSSTSTCNQFDCYSKYMTKKRNGHNCSYRAVAMYGYIIISVIFTLNDLVIVNTSHSQICCNHKHRYLRIFHDLQGTPTKKDYTCFTPLCCTMSYHCFEVWCHLMTLMLMKLSKGIMGTLTEHRQFAVRCYQFGGQWLRRRGYWICIGFVVI